MANQFLEEIQEWAQILDRVTQKLRVLQEKIKEEFDLPQLKDQLLTLPEQIKNAQVVAQKKKAELSEFEQQQMKQRVAETLFEINNEKGENGKAKFTNEPTRKAELTLRVGKDEQYLVLEKQRSAIEFKVWEFEADVDKLRNDFRSRLAIKDLIVAELNLYTK